MKHVMLTLGLAFTLAAGLNAQVPATANPPKSGQENRKNLTPAERAKKDADQAEKKLSLSGEQKAKWEAASLERANANAPIKEKMKGCTTPQERKDFKLQMKANREKYKTTVTALLTPEQKVKYEQMQKQKRMAHKARMKERHKHMKDKQNQD